jgi:hypothetical protein
VARASTVLHVPRRPYTTTPPTLGSTAASTSAALMASWFTTRDRGNAGRVKGSTLSRGCGGGGGGGGVSTAATATVAAGGTGAAGAGAAVTTEAEAEKASTAPSLSPFGSSSSASSPPAPAAVVAAGRVMPQDLLLLLNMRVRPMLVEGDILLLLHGGGCVRGEAAEASMATDVVALCLSLCGRIRS